MGQQTILLLSDVQLLAASPAGDHVIKSLKAHRDESNLRLDIAETFLLVASGCPRAVIAGMVDDPHQAFYGATSLAIPGQ